MERREFLKRTSQAMALAVATGSAGVFFHNRSAEGYRPPVLARPEFGVADSASLPVVTEAVHEDPVAALRAALDAVGGIGRFVHSGERVTVKPNIGWDRAPEQAATTHPLLVEEVVRQCLAAGAAGVIVTDVPCNDPRRTFVRSGISQAAERAGATVVLPTPEDYIVTDLGQKFLTEWPVLKYFVETDRLINMPIVKQHSLSLCTVGMKNLYGILGGRRFQLHQRIDQSIVDLVAFARPTLTVIDATRILTRGGPQGGSLDYVEQLDTVICATDPVAGDARACELLGLSGATVGHIALGETAGLGSVDYRQAGYTKVTL